MNSSSLPAPLPTNKKWSTTSLYVARVSFPLPRVIHNCSLGHVKKEGGEERARDRVVGRGSSSTVPLMRMNARGKHAEWRRGRATGMECQRRGRKKNNEKKKHPQEELKGGILVRVQQREEEEENEETPRETSKTKQK